MRVAAEEVLDDVVETRFDLDGVPGLLWTPVTASSSRPVPLVLAGQPGGPAGPDRTRPRMLERARATAAAGLSTATIELPGSGSHVQPPGVDDARAELRRGLAAGAEVPDDLVDRLVLPLVEVAVPEWRRTLDALLALPGLTGPVAYSGGVVPVGVRLAAEEPRIAAAVLFAGSFVPRSVLQVARGVTIPVYVLLQWDDEGNDRRQALDLFDAFGSREKTLNANLGGHTGVPAHAGDDAVRFLVRHVRPGPPR